MKNGIILARLQPIHNAHLDLIKMACNENDKVLVVIGSANKVNKRNPIPVDLRLKLVQDAVNSELSEYKNRISFALLDDLTSEEDNSLEWGFYLYANIISIINNSSFRMYYSDGFESITSWFTGYILRNHISLTLIARNTCRSGLAATDIRNNILNYKSKESMEYLKESVPENVLENVSVLSALIASNNNN